MSACATHSPLCTPALPRGPLLSVLRRGCDLCVCVSCTTSDTHRLQCCYHVFRVRPVCYLKRILQTLASSSAHVTCPRKAVLTLTPGTMHQRALEADFEQCPTHTLMISRCHKKAFFRYNFQISEILPGLSGGSCKHS